MIAHNQRTTIQHAAILSAMLTLVLTACGGSNEAQCESAWEQADIDSELALSLIISRDWPKGTVGAVVKECLEDGWKPYPSGALLPTPKPIRIRILDYECWRERGNMEFEGRVRNDSTADTYEFVRLRMIALDGNTIVGEEEWYINSDTLRPGAESSFDGFVQDVGKAGRCRVEFDSAQIAD